MTSSKLLLMGFGLAIFAYGIGFAFFYPYWPRKKDTRDGFHEINTQTFWGYMGFTTAFLALIAFVVLVVLS